MFASALRTSAAILGRAVRVRPVALASRLGGVRYSSGHEETDEEFDRRMTEFFKRKDIDGWDVRRGLQELHRIDGVPEPETIIAALHAIRRVNDHSLAVRFMEALKEKAADCKEIYPYLMQEIRPTLNELGISTPEELDYGKPELALQNPEEMHVHGIDFSAKPKAHGHH
ncbi:cytochrome c oxidase subunit 5A, mitochondrial-like [Paramacrobiotus metropolitanus]|uniref:cytochrome c oxidase subunit 5A, mitochondrial-like n=1 Tax=Paramacrobiotus metropolitanus TaxID=2943436 RepID=UPI0024461A43|nr:cytochrome c oxidase subunit 5A, mitochondrial-like [Paramacrobiotus metropolitanus]